MKLVSYSNTVKGLPCMQDFLQCLPFPEYSHPEGCLNVANYLSQDLVKPDLGPKSYIATGRSTSLALSLLVNKRSSRHVACCTLHICDMQQSVDITWMHLSWSMPAAAKCGIS